MSTFYVTPSDLDLMHHGVLGMKWGVRRYQPYSVVPRGSGQGGKEIGEAKRSASNHEIKKYAKKLGRANTKINKSLMVQNRDLASTEKVAEKMLRNKTRKFVTDDVAYSRYNTSLRNMWREADQFDAEIKFDEIFEEASKKFDKISMDSITEMQEKEYMKKADKYFNQSLEYRKQYIDLYDKNQKRINEIEEQKRIQAEDKEKHKRR